MRLFINDEGILPLLLQLMPDQIAVLVKIPLTQFWLINFQFNSINIKVSTTSHHYCLLDEYNLIILTRINDNQGHLYSL